MNRRWIGLAAIIIILSAGLWGWRASRPAAEVSVARPHVGELRAYIEERAVTELPHDYLVSMPIDGWLQRIELREGDRVTTNQTICMLDPDDLRDRVRQTEQSIAVLETEIKDTQDNRLEEHMLVEARAVVKAIDETVQAAEEQLEGSLAVYEFSKSEIERLKGLSEKGRITERELTEAKTEYRKAGADYRSDVLDQAALKTLAAVSYIGPQFMTDYIDRKSFDLETYRRQLDELRFELEIVKRNLKRATIESPVDGIVLERHQTRRQFLSAGTPLLTIGVLDDLEVIAEVLTERATRIEPGAPVEVFGKALADGAVQGRVLRVYPAGFKKVSSLGVEQQRVKVAIKLDQRPPRLGVGFRVHVRIIYDQAQGALTLPRTCLFRSRTGSWQVMAVRHDRTELQEVEIGLMNDDIAHVKTGLSTEDLVVLQPSKEITAGLRVRPVEQQPR